LVVVFVVANTKTQAHTTSAETDPHLSRSESRANEIRTIKKPASTGGFLWSYELITD